MNPFANIQPNSEMRDQADFVRISSRVYVGFAESAADYVEKTAEKMPTNGRNQLESNSISEECSMSALMVELG